MRRRETPGRTAPLEAEAPAPTFAGPAASVESLLSLQRTAGNAAVARLVQVARQETGSYQLRSPSLLQPPAPPGISLGDFRLRLDPPVRRQLDAELQRDRIRALLLQIPLSLLVPSSGPNPLARPPPPRPPSAGDRPPGPFDVTPTEPATPGDLVTALASVPEIDRLSAAARSQLWGRLPTQDKWTLAISAVTIGGAGLAGALASPSGRQALAGLGGRPLSIPGVPWFQPEFNVEGPNIVFGLHVDIGAFAAGRGGFGTADRAPNPMTPSPP